MNASRRALLALPLAAAAGGLHRPLAAQRPRMARLGVLASFRAIPLEAFSADMKRRGWEVGRNLAVEERFARGEASRYPTLAGELLAARVDVILALQDRAAEAAAKATRTVPIVMMGLAPVELGLAKSLARPGGNVTGVVFRAHEYAGKQIEILRALNPRLRRVGIVATSDAPMTRIWHEGWEAAAARLGVTMVPLPNPTSAAQLDATLEAAAREQVQAIEFGLNPALRGALWDTIAAWAIRHQVITSAAEFARGEAMLAFGANGPRFVELLYDQLDRVLRGADPAELPIQQPTVFDTVVHKRQLQAIGLTVPSAVRLQATEVIE